MRSEAGVFGPVASLRAAVTALVCPEPTPTWEVGGSDASPQTAPRGKARLSRLDWAALLKRVFRIDVLVCARCGGAMSVIAFTDRVTLGPHRLGLIAHR
jgi:hypothetical protein